MRKVRPSLTATRKLRVRAHVIADLSVNHVERFVLLERHTCERTRHDYGWDLTISTYTESGEIENDSIYVQLKAADAFRRGRIPNSIAVRISARDLDIWRNEALPVIIIAYDAKADLANWLYLQDYVENSGCVRYRPGQRTVTLYVPQSQLVDRNGVATFSGYKADVQAQTSGVAKHHA